MAVKLVLGELHDSWLSKAEFSNYGDFRLEFDKFAFVIPKAHKPVFWSGGVLSPTAISVCFLWDGEGDIDELGAEAPEDTFDRLKVSLQLYGGPRWVILFINNWGDEFAVFFNGPYEPTLIPLPDPTPKPNPEE